jgi:hypothetical protein
MAKTKGSINIRPGVGVLALFPSMNYKAWYALAELVDNSLDSYLRHRDRLHETVNDYQLRVVIEVQSQDGGQIRVWDNAAGIEGANFERAFVTAEPPADSAGLSQFGIGMKSASCWFARQWQVRSTALDETVERTVIFDVPRIVTERRETVATTLVDAPPDRHFTEIRLWDLHKSLHSETVGKMRRHLASMYRHFLRTGELVLEFNGEPLHFSEPKVLVVPYHKESQGRPKTWRKDLDFKLPTGERVTGFAGIRETGSTKDAGLSLYRHGRLIVGSSDDSYRPSEIFGASNSYRYQRVFGELTLDDFQVSHTKDGFIWEDKEAEFLRVLRKELDKTPLPLLDQAERHRAGRGGKNMAAAAARAAASAAEGLSHTRPTIATQTTQKPDAGPPPRTHGRTSIFKSKTLELDVNGQRWEIAVETTTDESATDWLAVREHTAIRPRTRALGILISLSHPFTQQFGGATNEHLEGLIRVAAGVAVAETTARESGVKMASTIRRNLNELLRGGLSHP